MLQTLFIGLMSAAVVLMPAAIIISIMEALERRGSRTVEREYKNWEKAVPRDLDRSDEEEARKVWIEKKTTEIAQSKRKIEQTQYF